MKYIMFQLYDSAVKAYNTPIFLRSKGEAIRSFQATVNEAGNNLNKWPDQYTLFEAGEYDDESGIVTMYKVKESLGTALQYKDQPAAPTPLEAAIAKAKE